MLGNKRALSSIRVLEMTVAVAGPVACHVLGDMGAEVIKVEEPNARAHTPRMLPRPRAGSPDHPFNRVPNWAELNRSKRHIAVDVSSPEGRDIFLRIAAVSDVVVENFSPRVMGNLGIDYEDLKKVNPSIIMVSMPAFGKSGPYQARGSYGPGIDAMSGVSHLTGYPDRGPGKPANFFCDQNAGLHAAFCIIAALRHRRRTGEGQYVEMSMLEGEVQSVAPAIMEAMTRGVDQTRIGNRHVSHAPHGVYACAGDDQWVAVAVTSDEQWRRLTDVIGRPELATDPRFVKRADRYANRMRPTQPSARGHPGGLQGTCRISYKRSGSRRGMPCGSTNCLRTPRSAIAVRSRGWTTRRWEDSPTRVRHGKASWGTAVSRPPLPCLERRTSTSSANC